jgi:hypothetical protein
MPPPLSLTENYYKILASEHPKIQIPNILQKWNSFQRFEHKGSIQILDRPHRFPRNVPARPIFLRACFLNQRQRQKTFPEAGLRAKNAVPGR